MLELLLLAVLCGIASQSAIKYWREATMESCSYTRWSDYMPNIEYEQFYYQSNLKCFVRGSSSLSAAGPKAAKTKTSS